MSTPTTSVQTGTACDGPTTMPDRRPVRPEKPMISVVVPCYNEERNIAVLVDRLAALFAEAALRWEAILVNDGSHDATWPGIVTLSIQHPQVVGLDLSRRFGKEVALRAGLDQAVGDAVVMMDADLQHPPETIPALVEAWREGAAIVDAVRDRRIGQGVLTRLQGSLFYWLFRRLSGLDIPDNVGDYRLFDRSVADVIRAMRERRPFMKGISLWVGFNHVAVPYIQAKRNDTPARGMSFRSRFTLALDAITSYSNYPLRIWTKIGFFVSCIAFFYIVFRVIRTVMWGSDVPGYESIVAIMLFLGGLQLIILGIVGEYIGRIYDEIKGRPLYVLRTSVGKSDRR